MFDRRAFASALVGGAAAGLTLPISVSHAAVGTRNPVQLFSSTTNDMGEDALTVLDGGETRKIAELPARGHAVSFHPNKPLGIIMARRPDRFAVVFDPVRLTELHRFEPPEDRHFYGHAIFHPDGRHLLTTENDFDNARGVIGIYDIEDGYRRLGEWDSGAIGPHELVLNADGGSVLIANGGIQTHPDTGRVKLNLDTMQSSMDLLDLKSGGLRRQTRLEDPAFQQLSLRHLATNGDGVAAIGGQWQGSDSAVLPLIAIVGSDGRQSLLTAPDEVQASLDNYCGSVAFDSSGKVVAVTHPRGNIATFWSVEGTPRYLNSLTMTDVCGVTAAARPGTFYLSSGNGAVVHANAVSGTLISSLKQPTRSISWDNHLAMPRG